MGFIWALIVGGVIGAIAGAITKKDHRWDYCQYHFSWFNNWSSHFRHMGTVSLAGMAIVPSIIGQ